MKTLEDIPHCLFTEKELDRNAFETKEQKIAYLDKLISWARLVLICLNKS